MTTTGPHSMLRNSVHVEAASRWLSNIIIRSSQSSSAADMQGVCLDHGMAEPYAYPFLSGHDPVSNELTCRVEPEEYLGDQQLMFCTDCGCCSRALCEAPVPELRGCLSRVSLYSIRFEKCYQDRHSACHSACPNLCAACDHARLRPQEPDRAGNQTKA